MRVHIFVATTAGPVRVQSVQRIEPYGDGPENASHVAVDGVDAARFSSRYRQFVDFVIGPRFRHRCFLVSVARDIEQGESWRLPLLLAHEVEAADSLTLVDADVAVGDQVVLATGQVTNDLELRPVDSTDEKVAEALPRMRAWLDEGARVVVAAPMENVAKLPAELAALQRGHHRVRILGASGVDDLMAQSPFTDAEPQGAAVSHRRGRIGGRVALLTVAVLALGGGIAVWDRAEAGSAVDVLAGIVSAVAGAVLEKPEPEGDGEAPRRAAAAIVVAPPPARVETELWAVREDSSGDCKPENAGSVVQRSGSRFATTPVEGLCALVLRPGADVTAAAWVDLAPLGRPPAVHRDREWWLPPPRVRDRDRQIALVLATGGDQASLNAWLDRWQAAAPTRAAPGTYLENLRRRAQAAPWPVEVLGHALRTY